MYYNQKKSIGWLKRLNTIDHFAKEPANVDVVKVMAVKTKDGFKYNY